MAYVVVHCHPNPANDGNTPVSLQARARDFVKTLMLMYLAQHLFDNDDQAPTTDLEELFDSHSDSDYFSRAPLHCADTLVLDLLDPIMRPMEFPAIKSILPSLCLSMFLGS